MNSRDKFSTQVDKDVLAEARRIAEKEGRQLQSIVEEALVDLISKRNPRRMRPHVLAAYKESLEKFGPLYERLAK